MIAGIAPVGAAYLMFKIDQTTKDQSKTVPSPLVENDDDLYDDDFVREEEAMMKTFKTEPSVRRPSKRSRVEFKPELVEEIRHDGTTAVSVEEIPLWQRELMEQ